mmetsp:Transcript_447/g.1161  ORF Transcript_447/g.1161 Transcript_447/m.1161 type:complete len:91 (+) Transcript_447:1050-1322(+)
MNFLVFNYTQIVLVCLALEAGQPNKPVQTSLMAVLAFPPSPLLLSRVQTQEEKHKRCNRPGACLTLHALVLFLLALTPPFACCNFLVRPV